MTVTRKAYNLQFLPALVSTQLQPRAHDGKELGVGAYSYVTVLCPYDSVLDSLSISEPR